MRVVVDTAEEARLAMASGADRILLRQTPSERSTAMSRQQEVRHVLGEGHPLGLVMRSDAGDAARENAADELFVGYAHGGETGSPGTAIQSARSIAILPAGQDEFGTVLDAVVRDGFGGIVLGGIDQSQRLLTLTGVGILQSRIVAARLRGLDVSIGGHLEVPDIPRLLAIGPDELLLDAIARDGGDASAPLDPDRLRLLRDLIPRTLPLESGPAAAPADCDRIFVRDWTVPILIGAYAHEREPQRVRFSVEADVLRHARRPSDLRHVVSYDLILDAIGRTTLRHVDLVETLAEDIARIVLAHPRVARVEITIEKLDLGPGSLGCRIVRTRDFPSDLA